MTHIENCSLLLSSSLSLSLYISFFSDWFDLAVWPLPASSCLFEEIPICLVAETHCQTQTALPEESLRQTRAAKSNGISNSQRPRKALKISQACWESFPHLYAAKHQKEMYTTGQNNWDLFKVLERSLLNTPRWHIFH